MYIQNLRKAHAKGFEDAHGEEQLGMGIFIPNSAALSLYGGEEESHASLPGIESRILARQPGRRFREQPQIPQAEAEADRLSAAVSSGSPEGVKADMGRRLGADFSGVRFHTGQEAAVQADAMGARAFTSGLDVYFGAGGFEPSVAAHELVHTVQQGAVDSGASTLFTPLGGVQRKPSKRKEEKGETLAEASRRRLGNIGPLIAGVAKKVGHAFSAVGHKVKDAVVGKVDSMVRQHHRAVDALNNNREDYAAMSRKDRFLWTLKNPLARMTASRQTEGTKQRNEHRDRIEEYASKLAGETRYDLGDAAYDPFSDPELMGPQPAQDDMSILQGVGGMAGQAVGETAEKAQPAPIEKEIPDSMVKAQEIMGIAGKPLSIAALAPTPFAASRSAVDAAARGAGALTKTQMGAGVASGVLGGVRDMTAAVNHTMNVSKAAGNGQRSDAVAHGLNALGSGVSAGANLHKAIAFGQALSGNVSSLGATQRIIPAAGIFAGGAQATGGVVQGVSALRTRHKMGNRMEAMKERREKGELSSEEERLYRTLQQAGKMAEVRIATSGMDVASGALKVTGNAMTLGGVTSLAGTVVSGVGSGVDIAKGIVADKMKKSRRTAVVEEEIGLEKKIQELVDKGMDPRDAKHVVLKSMGFASGKRKEAFQHITMRRAADLYKQAEQGDEEAQGILSDMGLHQTGGHYSLQGVAERLGMESNTSWQSQMYETAHSRDVNPFALAAAENREKKKKKA